MNTMDLTEAFERGELTPWQYASRRAALLRAGESPFVVRLWGALSSLFKRWDWERK